MNARDWRILTSSNGMMLGRPRNTMCKWDFRRDTQSWFMRQAGLGAKRYWCLWALLRLKRESMIMLFLLAAAWVGPGRSALQSAEQWCKRRYGRIHQVGKMSFCDKNMHKGRLKQHTKGSETGNHPQKVPRLQKRAPVMSERQPLCRRECNSIGRRWLWWNQQEAPMPEPVCKSQESGGYKGEVFIVGL